jgi:hypothetical protein
MNASAQQWIEKTSCNKNASKIVNEAINHLTNLEQLMAIGMAKAAVFPVPVCAIASTSSPLSIGGIALYCMSVGLLKASSTRLLLISGAIL